MRGIDGHRSNTADLAIKSAGAAREAAKRNALPLVVEVTPEHQGVHHVTYTIRFDGQTAQRRVRVDHGAGTAFPVFDTGYGALLEETLRQKAVEQRAALARQEREALVLMFKS